MLSIQTLGGLTIQDEGKVLALPPSKKTRALLAYLLLTTRPHRRDRLCEMFWDLPDDPRGALRWSLSKLRAVINDPTSTRLVADRERVELNTIDLAIDIRTIEMQLEQDFLDVNDLCLIFSQLDDPLLDGIDLPNHGTFQSWLTSERENIAKLHITVAKRLALHSDMTPDESLRWSRVWLDKTPFCAEAATQLLSRLRQLGHDTEESALSKELEIRFKKAGIIWPPADSSKTPHTSNLPSEQPTRNARQLLARQKIQFCETSDKVRIAYATVGEGPPLVKAANWLSHLELDWEAPIWSPLFRELARDHLFIRYDERGNGLSDWDVTDISFDAFVKDLETLVDALHLEKFPLLGISQGAAVSIEYAVRHPERVSHLVLFGAYAAGWRVDATPETIKEREAVMTLTETGWGQDNPAYRQIFSSTFMPSASIEELNWFNEFQRQTTSPENAARFQSAFGDIDVRKQLAKVKVPTLVIHSVGDTRIPISAGREIAASIPHAEFVCLDSDNHLLIGQESASQVFVEAVREFIDR